MNNSGATVRRILVVEENPEISLICSKVLSSKVFKVDIASDGETAEKMLQTRYYDLCIIDLGTLMNADNLLYHYMTEKYPKLLSGGIFTSGGIVDGDSKRFMDQTVRLFLHKPFAPEWLKAIVSKAVSELEDRERTNKTTDRRW